MNANEILKKHEDANEMHFHEVDRKWIIEAMEEYAALRQPIVSGCNADSDKLVECRNCGDKVEMISSGEFCPHCFC